jgi:K+-transporting ATPase ATPase C chain
MEKNENKTKLHVGAAIRIVVLMLAVVAAYSLVLVAIGQELFPSQSKGSLVTLDNGHVIGSSLIAQEFQSPKFFHPRSAADSASGLDPHITPESAFAQVDNVSQSTGISKNHLRTLIQLNIETNKTENLSAFAPNYVNVLELNLELTRQYPDVYAEFTDRNQIRG